MLLLLWRPIEFGMSCKGDIFESGCYIFHSCFETSSDRFRFWCRTQRKTKGRRHGSDAACHHRVCLGVAPHLSGDASHILLSGLAATMRDGGAALHRPMDRRAPELECGALAVRVSALKGKGGGRREGVGRLIWPGARAPIDHHLLQSFKSLSLIEKTASALISISLAMHCRESR